MFEKCTEKFPFDDCIFTKQPPFFRQLDKRISRLENNGKWQNSSMPSKPSCLPIKDDCDVQMFEKLSEDEYDNVVHIFTAWYKIKKTEAIFILFAHRFNTLSLLPAPTSRRRSTTSSKKRFKTSIAWIWRGMAKMTKSHSSIPVCLEQFSVRTWFLYSTFSGWKWCK